MDSPLELQDELEKLASEARSAAPVVDVDTSCVNTSTYRRNPIVIMDGLPQESLNALLGKILGIDPIFIEMLDATGIDSLDLLVNPILAFHLGTALSRYVGSHSRPS